MNNYLSLLLLCLSLSWLLLSRATTTNQIPKHYVVYMGAPKAVETNGNDDELSHLHLLSSIVPSEESERISVLHNYNHAFRGFSAMLTENEASLLSGESEVVSVFPDTMLQLHTTRSWDFLRELSNTQPYSKPSNDDKYNDHFTRHNNDVIIGVLDTGIWPESQSFSDKGFGPIPSRWKGTCMEGSDFSKSNCNRKLIGARYYSDGADQDGSPRDQIGHGTHVASTAAGAKVANASYFGLAKGTARGGAPFARIASYKVCSADGCSGASILKAFDDAIKDGVDIISISIGIRSFEDQVDYLYDPIAIGAFHAEQKGVMVIGSAGNDGPTPRTVLNTAPWIFTVAASTTDRAFQSSVLLGNGKVLKGFGINFSRLLRSATYPLVYARNVAANSSMISSARKCTPGSMDAQKIAGKIVVCVASSSSMDVLLKVRGRRYIKDSKSKGLIMIEEDGMIVPSITGNFSYSEVAKTTGSQILKYIISTRNPKATIFRTVEFKRQRPNPVVSVFSSRGPAVLTQNIIKPDIMAPGENILAAIVPNISEAFVGNKPPQYALRSGTSMACPHVSGAAAFVKSLRPLWSSSMIRSALMTTANIYDTTRKPLTNSSKNTANPHEVGSGEIDPVKALNPGLVFETTTKDYLMFLCYFGYPEKSIRSMITATNLKLACPKNPRKERIATINYPSISLGKLGDRRVIKRTVTNVGPSNSTYSAEVQSPKGLLVRVFPKKISFTEGVKNLSFRVLFDGKRASKGYNFGVITLTDGRHSVRVAYAVNVE